MRQDRTSERAFQRQDCSFLRRLPGLLDDLDDMAGMLSAVQRLAPLSHAIDHVLHALFDAPSPLPTARINLEPAPLPKLHILLIDL